MTCPLKTQIVVLPKVKQHFFSSTMQDEGALNLTSRLLAYQSEQ